MRRNVVSRGIGIGAMAVLLGACGISGGGGEKDQPAEVREYGEHMDISVAYWQIDNALELRDEDEVLKTIEKKFNVTIVPKNVTWDDYYNKISLWAETGQLPDLFAGAFRTEERPAA